MSQPRKAPGTASRLAFVAVVTAVMTAPAATRADPPGHGEHRGYSGHGRYEQHHDHGREHGYYYRVRPGTPVRALPHGYYSLHAPHHQYYVHGGQFYERAYPGFVVVRPPIGVVVATLPFGYLSLSITGSNYFFSGGVYYRPAPSGYVVVAPPYPTAAATGMVVVQASALNVRLGPGLDYGVVGVVSGGIQLPVYGSTPNWYYVRTPNGNFGWVMMNFTAPLNVPQG